MLQAGRNIDPIYRTGNIVDDASGPFSTSTKQKPVAKLFCPLTNQCMGLAFLVALCPMGNQSKCDRRLPVLIGAAQELAGIYGVVKFRQVMGEGAVLQICLIAGDECPSLGCLE